MGCTEPIAIAYCAAVSRAALGGLPDKVRIVVSGNIVKNVKSVIVPNTGNRKGLTAAAAIGILGGDEQAELEVISRVSRETIEKLPAYLDATTFEIVPVERGFLLDIEIVCSRGADTATARIVQEHTNIILVEKNGTVLYHKDPQPELADTDSEHLSLRGIYDFVQSCDLADIAPLLERQIADNTAIAEVGLRGQYGAAIGTLLLGGWQSHSEGKGAGIRLRWLRRANERLRDAGRHQLRKWKPRHDGLFAGHCLRPGAGCEPRAFAAGAAALQPPLAA